MIVTIAGGVGGAKMAHGLAGAINPADQTVIVNTADDFELHGLHISPDIDTVLYTLGGLANPVQGWGIEGDTRAALDAMTRLGEEPWFLLGDQDIATHVLRTARRRHGSTLSQVTADFARSLGIESRVLPVTDDPIATFIETPSGTFAFQDYFVRRRQQDDVVGVRFAGIAQSRPAPGVLEAIADADTIIIAPSNPIVSVAPVLDVPGVQFAVETSRAIKIAVSPIVGGRALKGPADKMLTTLGHEPSAVGIARIYAGLVDGLVIDNIDTALIPEIEALGLTTIALQSIMGDAHDRARFGREVLAFAESLRTGLTS
jgi:LPPG:FO 2-phospho-L-lactate transferase